MAAAMPPTRVDVPQKRVLGCRLVHKSTLTRRRICRSRRYGLFGPAKVIKVGFNKWSHGDASPRHARRRALTADTGRLFATHTGNYGSPRIWADLCDEGWRISVNTVAAIMREQGWVARPKRRRRGATRPGKGRWRAPDRVKRKFAAQQLNGKWYGDGTEVNTDEGSTKGISRAVFVSQAGDLPKFRLTC